MEIVLSTTTPNAPATRVFTVPTGVPMISLVGPSDEFLRRLEDDLDAEILVRGNEVRLSGSPDHVSEATEVLTEMVTILRTGHSLRIDDVDRIVTMTRKGEAPAQVMTADIISHHGHVIRPKTRNQKRYVDAMDANTIVFGIGPAGTGKTYLAMAKAVQALHAKKVSRIILTRPAVEAGEKMGFLPGTLTEKIDPYLRPLHDALRDMVGSDAVPRLMDSGTVEVAPLAYMRGRTLRDPRRGPEHLATADEDVPHPTGVRVEDRRHRRHHPDRPSRFDAVGPASGTGNPGRCRRHRLLQPHQHRCGTPRTGGTYRRRLRPLRCTEDGT